MSKALTSPYCVLAHCSRSQCQICVQTPHYSSAFSSGMRRKDHLRTHQIVGVAVAVTPIPAGVVVEMGVVEEVGARGVVEVGEVVLVETVDVAEGDEVTSKEVGDAVKAAAEGDEIRVMAGVGAVVGAEVEVVNVVAAVGVVVVMVEQWLQVQ